MDEYEQVQRLRELWSRSITTWGQVLLPLGAAIIAFFVLLSKVGTGHTNFQLLFIGWLLFTICMVYWRLVVYHIDRQIIELYPAMLRLDSTNKWDTQTRYYFNNLANRSRNYLRHQLGLEHLPDNYDDFVDGAKHQHRDHYGLLLSVWRSHGWRSVTSRGHMIQDIAVFTAVVLFLVTILWVGIGAWALWALLLFIPLALWGRHRGWWFV